MRKKNETWNLKPIRHIFIILSYQKQRDIAEKVYQEKGKNSWMERHKEQEVPSLN